MLRVIGLTLPFSQRCLRGKYGIPPLMRSLFSFFLLGVAVALPARAAPSPQAILKLAEAEQAAFLSTLQTLVEIESGSHDPEGLENVEAFVAQRLTALGGAVERIPAGADVYRMEDTPEKIGGMVKATFTGTGTKKILLIAHLDTVYPRGTLAKQPFRLDGNRAYGLGVSDDKQGVAVILHAVGLLQKLAVRDYGVLTVFINGDEEISSPASRALLTKLGAEHDVVLSYEATPATQDSLVLATSGIAAAKLIVRGRGSHAGIAPERGVNALYELAHQVLQLRDLSEPAVGLKVNWTMAHAGIVRNMIPPEATAEADIRVLRLEDYERIEKTLRDRIQNKLLPESTVELRFERRRPPLEATEVGRTFAAYAQQVYREIGRDLVISATPEGGGTDAAFAAVNATGPVVERMGLQGFGAHSTNDEYVIIDSIPPRLYLSVRLVIDIAQGKTH